MMLKWRNLSHTTDEELRQSVRMVVAILVTLFVVTVVVAVATV